MDNMDSLFIAGLKGMSAGFALGVLVAIIALLVFIYKKFILPKINKTKDIASAISNHGTEAIKGYMEKHAHTTKTNLSNENDDLLYEYVLEEIEKNDLQKGLWAKSLALSEGNNDKAKSLYMQYRVQAIKEELNRLHIDPSSLSPQRIWHILENGITPEEQETLQKERKDKQEIIYRDQEKEKYGKIRGWLLFFAIILVIGDFSYLEIFKLFTTEHKEAMQDLFIKASPIFSYMNTTSYIFFSGLFFNILLTISFFAKYRSTRSIAIVFFIFNILFTIMQANLFFVLKNNISDEIFNAMYSPNEIFKEFLRPFVVLIISLVWIFYFIYSERVKKTFTKESDFPTLIFISAIIPVILFMVYGGNIRDIENSAMNRIKQEKQKTVEATQLKSSPLLLMVQNEKWGFIDTKGNWVIQPIFDSIGAFYEGLVRVKLNDKYGFIDKKGNLVIQPTFDNAGAFTEGLAVVNLNGKWGYIDKKGNLVIQPIFDYATFFSKGLAAVNLNGKYGYIDKKGNLIIQPMCDYAGTFTEDLAKVKLNGKYGFINTKGDWVIQPISALVGDFSEGLADVNLNGKFGYIDKKGNWVIQPIFLFTNSFSEGIARVYLNGNGKWGYIDKKGNWVIQPIFDSCGDFSEGLARVQLNGKWGYVDKKGNWIVNPM